jgi:hypothetical protein
MSIRSMMFAVALGAVGTLGYAGSATADGGATQNGGGNFSCSNKLSISVVQCVGSISVLPISVTIKDVRALDGNELSILSGDLNHVSLLDGGILDHDKILNDVEVTTLQDFLNKFAIDVTKNDVDVCTTVLGAALCK